MKFLKEIGNVLIARRTAIESELSFLNDSIKLVGEMIETLQKSDISTKEVNKDIKRVSKLVKK